MKHPRIEWRVRGCEMRYLYGGESGILTAHVPTCRNTLLQLFRTEGIDFLVWKRANAADELGRK